MRHALLHTSLAVALAAGFAAVPGAGPGSSGAAWADFPEKPIRIIVGFAPGGRTDVVARLIANFAQENELLSQPMVVVNMPGGGGAVGAREILNAEPDGHTIGHWHHQMLIASAMENVDFGPDDFTSIGYTGGGSPVWTVRANSDFHTLDDLVQHLHAQPRSLVEVIGVGTIPHFVGALLAREAGFETRYISGQSGADRAAAILGGHADISLFAASEYLGWRDGDPGLRALVFFGPNRIDNIPDVPTAQELGYDVTWANPNWWLGPPGMPQEIVDQLADVLEQAMQDPEIQAYFAENALDAYWTPGEEAAADARAMLESLKEVAATIE